VSEIAEFILAQYARIEKAAKLAAMAADPDGLPGDQWTYDGTVAQITDERGHIVLAGEGYGGTWLDHACGEHIALHDPAYVLADIESKRRIMTEIVEQIDGMDAQLECEFGTGSSDRADESEKLLHLLAAPFSGEPGYDERWTI
jgi:hypothetical protein